MRSRYAAFALGDADYLFRTWHPRTRPATVTVDPDVVWRGLDVTDVVAGGRDDQQGEVEFTAFFDDEMMYERSQFERRAGRWVYLDGTSRTEYEVGHEDGHGRRTSTMAVLPRMGLTSERVVRSRRSCR